MELPPKELPRPQLLRTIRSWLFIIMCLLFFLNVCGGLLELFLEEYQNAAEQSTSIIGRDLDTLLSSMIDQETGLRGYITTADPEFLAPFYQGRTTYRTTLPHLAQILQAKGFKNTRAAFIQFNMLAEKWYGSFALIQLHLIHDNNYATARSIRNAKQGKFTFDAFRIATKQLKNIVNEDTEALQNSANALKIEIVITLVIATLLLLMLIWILAQRNFNDIGKQIKVLLATMATYNQDDYHIRMEPMKYAEFNTFLLGFKNMMTVIEQQQQKIRKSEFRLLTDTLPQMVWTAKPDGWIDYYNQKWFDYTGMTLEQTQGWSWEPLVYPDDLQRCIDTWTHSLTTGEDYQIEFRLKQGLDGMYRWHLARALPLRDAAGTIMKWFGAVTDIEDLKHTEQMLVKAVQDQHNFVSTVSHEFRTALTSIQGFSELLSEADFEKEQVKDYANDIHIDAMRLNRMINDLLDLEKMQSGRAVLEMEEIDFKDLVSEVVGRMDTISGGHRIDFMCDEYLPLLDGDRDKLTQIMYNLLSNAIKYSPHGGHILVTISKEGTQIHVYVQDQGIGIPKEALEVIFRPYNRVHAEDTRYIKGTGLGLPIVHHLVELHRGHIWVESVPGQGSTFHFTLPIKRTALLTDEVARPAPLVVQPVEQRQRGSR